MPRHRYEPPSTTPSTAIGLSLEWKSCRAEAASWTTSAREVSATTSREQVLNDSATSHRHISCKPQPQRHAACWQHREIRITTCDPHKTLQCSKSTIHKTSLQYAWKRDFVLLPCGKDMRVHGWKRPRLRWSYRWYPQSEVISQGFRRTRGFLQVESFLHAKTSCEKHRHEDRHNVSPTC